MNTRREFRSAVGKVVGTVTVPQTVVDDEDIHPQNLKPLASYNWINDPNPTIMVPGTHAPFLSTMNLIVFLGAPGMWNPPAFPLRVPQDSGLYYIDQNGHRHPAFPLEPLFRAVFIEQSDFSVATLDLVTDRNNLRKIVWAISGERIEDFRIDIQLVGKTLLFQRWETNTSEYIVEFRGYGHSFEKMCTTYSGDGMKASTGHHRVVKYNLAGLEVLTRFEVDAYYPDDVSNTGMGSSSRTAPVDMDALTSSLQKVQLTTSQRGKIDATSTLRVIEGGYKAPHSSLIEIKTRAQHRPIQISDVIYQLWFAQVRHLIAGYHSRGRFIRSEQKDFVHTGEFRKFEQRKGDDLRKFVKVVEGIRTAMVRGKIKKAVLLFEGSDMKLYERSGVWNSLPADLLARWE